MKTESPIAKGFGLYPNAGVVIKILKLDVPAIEPTLCILTPFVLFVAISATFPTVIPVGDWSISTSPIDDPEKIAFKALSGKVVPASVSTTTKSGAFR